jgi:hypothetical protein
MGINLFEVMKMWGDEQWNKWGGSQGFYKVWETIDGNAKALGIEIQLKHDVGAIVKGEITVIEPIDEGSDEEIMRIDIDLPKYQERWEAAKGSRKIKSTYALGDDAAPASDIISESPIESVEDFAKFACEYLHELDPKIAYPDFRQAMRHF